MKNKILILIIGILIGAVLTSIGFYIYQKNNTNTNGGPDFLQNGEMPQMPNGGNGQTPPNKPSGDNSETPPAKPSGESSGTQQENSNGQMQTNNSQNSQNQSSNL